jgi:hypothetical protein
MSNQAFSKIWIMITLMFLVAGGILAYQLRWQPQKEMEVKVPKK